MKQAPTADAKINWLRFFGEPIAAVRSELQQDVLSRQVHPMSTADLTLDQSEKWFKVQSSVR
jgi:hypothetical protein